MDKNREIIHIIENLKKQKELLNSELNLGIIDVDGAEKEDHFKTSQFNKLIDHIISLLLFLLSGAHCPSISHLAQGPWQSVRKSSPSDVSLTPDFQTH